VAYTITTRLTGPREFLRSTTRDDGNVRVFGSGLAAVKLSKAAERHGIDS
jgi:hypothetical protein